MLFTPLKEGVPKTGGRRKGTPNKAMAEEIRAAAAELLLATLRTWRRSRVREKTEEK